MRDDDELGPRGQLAQHPGESQGVLLVQWRIDLIEDAERRGADQEAREDERHRGQRPLSPRQHRDVLQPLAGRLGHDVHARLVGFLILHQNQLGPSPLEDLVEHLVELHLEALERLHEQLPRGAVDAGDDGFQRGDGLGQVFLLGRQEADALLHLAMLVDGHHVDGPQFG